MNVLEWMGSLLCNPWLDYLLLIAEQFGREILAGAFEAYNKITELEVFL
jgi:hypothetical protein